MIKFNPENKDVLTYDETVGPAMLITDQAEADAYLADYLAYTRKWLAVDPHPKGLTAEEIVRINLGYESGYCSMEVQERVEKLFHTKHPIFGKIKEDEKDAVS
jgi:hypothetical protein